MKKIIFVLILPLYLFSAYNTIYSNKNESFSDSSFSYLSTSNQYYIYYSTTNKFPVSDFKFFLPPFVKRLTTGGAVYGSGQNGTTGAYISFKNLPNTTSSIQSSTSILNKILDGQTITYSQQSSIALKEDVDINYYQDETKLNNWIYFKIIKGDHDDYFNSFSVSMYLDKNLVDTYVAGQNYPQNLTCENEDAAKKNICYFVKNILNDSGQSTDITINVPTTISAKACSGTNNIITTDSFTASGSSDYNWSITNDGILTNTTGTTTKIKYNTNEVKIYNSTIKVKGSSGASAQQNFTFEITKDLSLKQNEKLTSSSGELFNYNASDLIICKANKNTPTAWRYIIKKDGITKKDESSQNISFTPNEDGNYTIDITADNETTQLTLTIKEIKPIQFKSLTLNKAYENNNYTYDLNNLLQEGSPAIWEEFSKLPDDNSSVQPNGIFTWTKPKAGTYTFTLKAKNSKSSQTKEVTLVVESIIPPLVAGVPVKYIIYNTPYEYQFAINGLQFSKTQIEWALSTAGLDNIPENITLSDSGKLNITEGLQKGLYKLTITTKYDDTINVKPDSKYSSTDFNITVKDPIKILSIDSNNTQTCSSNYKYLVKDGDNLSIALSNPTDNLTWILKDDNTSKTFNPTPSNGKYIGKLSSGNPYDDLHDIEIKVTSDDDKSTDTKTQKFIVTQDKAYVGLLDENGNILKDNQQITLKKGVRTQFKAIGFGTPKCSITIDQPINTITNNDECSFSISKEGDYNIAIEITPDTCTENTDTKTINLKANIPDTNIVPILMYLLD